MSSPHSGESMGNTLRIFAHSLAYSINDGSEQWTQEWGIYCSTILVRLPQGATKCYLLTMDISSSTLMFASSYLILNYRNLGSKNDLLNCSVLSHCNFVQETAGFDNICKLEKYSQIKYMRQ